MTLRALIFDVDGTLAETEELHRRAFNEAFAAAGLPWHWTQDEYRRLLTTTGGKERIARFMAGIDGPPPDIAALHADKTARYAALVGTGQITPRAGIGGLIDEARAGGLALAVATTTSRPNVEALSRALWGCAATAMFDAIAAGDEVAAKKPAPDVYRLALARLGLHADEALAFEDSRNGLRAALGAGLSCVVSPGVYTRGEDFTGARIVVGEFSDLGGLAPLQRG